MKILLIGPVPPHVGGKSQGGVVQHLWSLAKKLEEKNIVDVLGIGRFYGKTCKKDGILVYGLDKNLRTFLKFLQLAPLLIRKIGKAPSLKIYFHALNTLYRLIGMNNLEGYDVIHIHGWNNMVLMGLEVLDIEVPAAVTIHSYHDFLSLSEKKTEVRITYINRYLRRARCLIHVSEADLKKGIELGLEFGGFTEVVHNGISAPSKKEIKDGPALSFVGSLIPRKRITLLLESLPFLKSDINFCNIIGDGEKKKEVKNAASNNSKIIYHGLISNEEVRKVLQQSSLLVVPSLSESFGLVYIEALFEGCAVLGYAPTLREFQKTMNLSAREKKVLVPLPENKLDARLLAEKIDATYQFRRSEEGKEAMQRVREKAISQFEWSAIIDQIQDIYKKIKA